jgi:hypothetical protein
MMHPILQARLRPVARRLAARALGWRLAGAWTLAAAVAVGLWTAQRLTGWSSSLSWALAAGLGLALAVRAVWRTRRSRPDWPALAARLETAYPDLQGRLLTAVEIALPPGRGPGYLEQRVILEACDHARLHDWRRVVPRRGVLLAHAGQLAALAGLVAAVGWLRSSAPPTLLAVAPAARGLTVTPGDVTLERGQNLVVLARFGGDVPPAAELVWQVPGEEARRTAMTRSLNDPLFGGSVVEVRRDFTYRVESAAGRSPDFTVTVFEYPRLEGADADLEFPPYTGLAPRHIAETRRVSAVEGTRVTLALRLNKPVAAAHLVPRAASNAAPVALTVATNLPAAALADFPLTASQTYELRLVDAEGRTNKEPATFVFSALPNRRPELKLTAPRGDLRPSPLEEVAFAGTVWDDFGLRAYGLAWMRPGAEPVWIELGRDVPAREKRAFAHLLALEPLDLAPQELLSWFAWAEDLGPDGQPRRTTSDLFFAEVRPFEEIFREADSAAGGAQQAGNEPGGEQDSPGARLVELQKQIMTATWKLLRELPPPRAASNAPPPTTRRLPPPPGAGPFFARPVSAAGSAAFLAQRAPEAPARRRAAAPSRPPSPGNAGVIQALRDDLEVIRQAQEQAYQQAREAGAEVPDPRLAELWDAAQRAMQQALEKLEAAGRSPEALREAFAAEQAAYQALLKLQEREYAVTRNRNRQGRQAGNSRQQQMQRQLDQLELTREENRYETESRARPPDSPERREQLQALNRLRELARRQQDLNERLRELQTALEEARTPAEREALRRELKRLQEQEQQLLNDLDELQQRLDRPENQSRLAETRQQLEQTRRDLERANQALREGATSPALAAGTRAQDRLEQARDQLRRDSAGEFAEDLRDLRAGARELTRQQEEVARRLEALNDPARRTLSDAEARQELLDRLARQRQQLTNLLARATEVSQQTEEPEPLVSRQLYDTLRRFTQDDGTQMRRMRQELLDRGLLTYSLDDRLEQGANQPAQGLELTAELLRQGYLRQAGEAGERARNDLDNLRRGIELAAEKVLGDDTQALRRARSELDELTEQLRRENPEATTTATAQNDRAGERAEPGTSADASGQPDEPGAAEPQSPGGPAAQNQIAAAEANASAGESANARGQDANRPGGDRPAPRTARAGENSDRTSPESSPESNPSSEGTDRSREPGEGAERAAARPAGGAPTGPGGRGDRWPVDLDQLLPGGAEGGRRGGPRDGLEGPITGADFANWADRLREVEELVEFPDLRSRLALARERARQLRLEFRRERQKPDWAVLRLEVLAPLVEVRDQIAEELARRGPREQLVPADRDPVPARFSELVRRYYEELGRAPRP